jgi:hypothetical protein
MRTIIWWVGHLRAILVHTHQLILCFCWRCHHVLQGLPQDVSELLARTPAAILWEGRPRKHCPKGVAHGLVLVSVRGPDWDLCTMHELLFCLFKSKVSLLRADTAKKRRHFTKWRSLQQIIRKRRQFLSHVLGTWEGAWDQELTIQICWAVYGRKRLRNFYKKKVVNSAEITKHTILRKWQFWSKHAILYQLNHSVYLWYFAYQPKIAVWQSSVGAEMESAEVDGPRRRRWRRKNIESDLGQLPDAISLLIVVVHDTISLFEALEPFAIP